MELIYSQRPIIKIMIVCCEDGAQCAVKNDSHDKCLPVHKNHYNVILSGDRI